MPMEGEQAQCGWKLLAEYMGFSERKAFRLRNELKDCRAVFYVRLGRPPRKRVCWFPSEIRRWARLKGAKGEVI